MFDRIFAYGPDKTLDSAIIAAAVSGNDAEVEALLGRNADANVADRHGWTPLHWACRNGHEAVVKPLLNKGADINKKGKFGSTPLHWAVKVGPESLVHTLLDHGADIHSTNNSGFTAIQLAHDSNQDGIVALLEARGADPKDKDGKPLLPKPPTPKAETPTPALPPASPASPPPHVRGAEMTFEQPTGWGSGGLCGCWRDPVDCCLVGCSGLLCAWPWVVLPHLRDELGQDDVLNEQRACTAQLNCGLALALCPLSWPVAVALDRSGLHPCERTPQYFRTVFELARRGLHKEALLCDTCQPYACASCTLCLIRRELKARSATRADETKQTLKTHQISCDPPPKDGKTAAAGGAPVGGGNMVRG